MKKELTVNDLIKEAKLFCQLYSGVYMPKLYGITDGKAVGTLVEHLFQEHLIKNYELLKGNSAEGLDLPSVNTDIKVTSTKRPQSSCPFRDSKQKIFGLGYNLLLFVYRKHDDHERREGMLEFVTCRFIDKSRTGDYQTTTGLNNIISNHGNQDDVFAFLNDHHIPGDEVTLYRMSDEIIKNPPQIGYLTISNALQWRLHYGHIVSLDNEVSGIKVIIGMNDGQVD